MATGISTDSAQGRETTGNNRHEPDNQDTRPGRRTDSPAARWTSMPSENPQVRGLVSALAQVSCDDHALDLVGALEDLRHLGLAHVALDGEVAGVPGAAEHLDRVGGDLHGHVGG